MAQTFLVNMNDDCTKIFINDNPTYSDRNEKTKKQNVFQETHITQL